MNRQELAVSPILPRTTFVVVLIFTEILASSALAAAYTESVLHAFTGGTGGQSPYASVVFDQSGNLYGTTVGGGTFGRGTIFKLTPQGSSWTETVLYSFHPASDGSQPYGGVIFDQVGNLYGTTYRGGAANAGTVFELSPPAMQGGNWTETVLYSFAGGSNDGIGPQGGLLFDQVGNIYGTTDNGAISQGGIVFELTPPAVQGGNWTETVLHRFTHNEGISPRAALIFDANGALYGTCANGGGGNSGSVFQLTPPATQGGAWTEATLHTFVDSDGDGPLDTLVFDQAGNLYGTTVIGGASGVGTVFQLAPPAILGGTWTLIPIHDFTCGSDGCYPWAGLIMDANGALYGTTQFGGLPSNGGTVFKLTPPAVQAGAWTETVLHSFTSSSAMLSAAGLTFGAGGTLFGTTIGSSMHAGIVFELLP
jgi:uncharacterized repeat protein (TIGR03803 family)